MGLTAVLAMLTARGVDGGGAARVGSWISPVSLEKRQSGGAARHTAMAARGRGVDRDGVMAAIVLFANGVAAVVDAAGADLGGGMDGDEGPTTGGMPAKATGTQLEGPAMFGHGGGMAPPLDRDSRTPVL